MAYSYHAAGDGHGKRVYRAGCQNFADHSSRASTGVRAIKCPGSVGHVYASNLGWLRLRPTYLPIFFADRRCGGLELLDGQWEGELDSRRGLPSNTVLADSYRIERVIGSGGFGITYLAEDVNLKITVALKEYYPQECGTRDQDMRIRAKSVQDKPTFEWGRSNSLQEARTLARFQHPSVVRVRRVFEANSTAYMVMDFERGQNFEVWLKVLARPPTQEELDRIAPPLLGALELMHAEISPSRHCS
jgi:Protein kinase domain